MAVRVTEFARSLVRAGAPVFRVYLIDGELKLPTGWETTIPGHAAQLDRWREGEGLAMVCGGPFDVIDYDPRNDPTGEGLKAIMALMPNVYAIVDTPSGGRHFYIAALGLAKKQSIFPGVDYQGGQPDGHGKAFVFLPGTQRKGGVYTVIVPLASGFPDTDESGWPLIEHIKRLRAPKEVERRTTQIVDDDRLQRYGVSATRGAIRDYGNAPAGTGNAALFNTLCRIVELENAGVAIDWPEIKVQLSGWDTLRIDQGAGGQMHEYDERLASARKTVGDKAAEVPDRKELTLNGQAMLPKERASDDAGTETVGAPAVADSDSSDAGSLILTRASTFAIKRVRWLWHDRIPLGEITLVAGREGVGKSTYLADLAAKITRGRALGEYREPRSVIYVANEDSWNHTIVPRMKAAGADLDLIYHVVPADGSGLSLPQHVEQVAQAAKSIDAAALMCDPIISMVDGRLSTDKARELRQAIEPLRRAAESAGIGVLALVHFNKTQGVDVLSKIAGARGWVEVARAVIAIAKDEEAEHIVLSQVKNNLGRLDLANWAYKIVGHEINSDDGLVVTSRVEWIGKVDKGAGEVIEQTRPVGRPKSEDGVKVIAAVLNAGRSVSISELRELFPYVSDSNLKAYLSRSVQRGEIKSVSRGVYGSP